MSLYDATKDLHHVCETHALGGRMSKGNVTPQEWADWLWAFRCLHSVVDQSLPAHMSRDGLLAADLSVLPNARPSATALKFAASLVGRDVTGAAYVLHGAHRSGGRVMAPVLAKRGLPCGHTAYRNSAEAKDWIVNASSNLHCVPIARETFGCLLAVMDEIIKTSCNTMSS
tara:strand:+ start:4489 stop:5001 length:513 start_codon:yes stop_codon:yes gene_type:complete